MQALVSVPLVSKLIYPLCPSIHKQILETDLNTLFYGISEENFIKDQSMFPSMIIFLILLLNLQFLPDNVLICYKIGYKIIDVDHSWQVKHQGGLTVPKFIFPHTVLIKFLSREFVSIIKDRK